MATRRTPGDPQEMDVVNLLEDAIQTSPQEYSVLDAGLEGIIDCEEEEMDVPLPDILQPEKLQQVINYIEGKSQLLPREVISMMVNGSWKINQLVAFIIFLNLPPLLQRVRYLEKLERKHFNEAVINSLTDEQRTEQIGSLRKNVMGVLEFARKFVAQNRGIMEEAPTEEKTMVEFLRNIPKEKMKILISKMQTGEIRL